MANKKITELTSATLPLAGTEELAIVQGGETKKVAASDLGGTSLRAITYEHNIMYTFNASTLWYGYRYNAAGSTRHYPNYETGYYDGVTVKASPAYRGWADVVQFNQKVTDINVRQLRNVSELTIHVVYFELSGATIVNTQLIKEIILPADAPGISKEIQNFTVTPFTMSKNGLISVFFFNNNIACAVGNLSIYINAEEVIL